MDALPVELYQEIFVYLELADVFNLRLVNKRLKGVVSLYRVKELIFETGYKYRYNWSFNRQPINYLNVLPSAKQFILRSAWFDTCGLRSLKISLARHRCYRVKLSHINNLVDLCQLEIDASVYDPEDNQLVLPQLKALSFSIAGVDELPGLLLDLPKLEQLDLCCSMHGLTFKHPQTVRQLKVVRYEPMLNIFRNVERLEWFYFELDESDDKKLNLFETYPQLTELAVEQDKYDDLYGVIVQRDRLEKHELKIYYRSLECLSGKELYTYKSKDYYISCYTLQQHFKHYQRLANDLHFVNEMEYSTMIRKFGSMPLDFFEKYTNIQKLYVVGYTNPERFLKFIGNCRNLGLLSIVGTFDQTFYDRLPSVSTLNELHIDERGSRSHDGSFDLRFVFRMDRLQVFHTNLRLTTKQVRLLCGTPAKRLGEVAFHVNRCRLQVQRTSDARYRLKNASGDIDKMLNLDSLIASLENLKKDEKITRSKVKRMRTA